MTSRTYGKINLATLYTGLDIKHNGAGKRKGWLGKLVEVDPKDDRIKVEWRKDAQGTEFASGKSTYQWYHYDWAEVNLLAHYSSGEIVTKDEPMFIVWCPTSQYAPRKILNEVQADKAIIEMAEAYQGQVFYKCRLERKAMSAFLLVEDL